MYARIGVPYCLTQYSISSQSIEEMVIQIMNLEANTKLRVLSPIVHGEKGMHKDTFEKIKKEGFTRIRVNGDEYEIDDAPELDKNQKHNIDIIVDRLIMKEDIRSRLYESIETAVNMAKGKAVIDIIGGEEIVMSEKYACPHCDFSLPELEPRMFSFNAPFGACPDCKGLGIKLEIDSDLIVPNKDISISEGALVPLNHVDDNIYFSSLVTTCEHYGIDIHKPFKNLKKAEQNIVFYGSKDKIDFKYVAKTVMLDILLIIM